MDFSYFFAEQTLFLTLLAELCDVTALHGRGSGKAAMSLESIDTRGWMKQNEILRSIHSLFHLASPSQRRRGRKCLQVQIIQISPSWPTFHQQASCPLRHLSHLVGDHLSGTVISQWLPNNGQFVSYIVRVRD
ncbi:hypothetical protein EDB80DRAFT_129732 [Ilyonectria destructans]|nr:hypothetical protein EDB80DRAFT_129732 [Ilyonectria destructans]